MPFIQYLERTRSRRNARDDVINFLSLPFAMKDAKEERAEPGAPPRTSRSILGSCLLTVLVILSIFVQLYTFLPARSRPDLLHPATHAVDRGVDFTWLSHEKQCPALRKIGIDEFTARRDRLAGLLSGDNGKDWGAYVTEPR